MSNRKTKTTKINISYYNEILKRIKQLCDVYKIDISERIMPDPLWMSLAKFNVHIKKLITKFETDTLYHPYVIEHLMCFLNYPKLKSDKNDLWKQIIDFVKTHNIKNSYDIIKKYNNCHDFTNASDILLIFDANDEKITRYVKTLNNMHDITNLLIELYDNDIHRLIFDDNDMNDIIFNNYRTIDFKKLEQHYVVNRTIKKIFDVLSDPKGVSKKFPNFTDDELIILGKYIFTYETSENIKLIVKRYKIKICDDHINWYSSNDRWSSNFFEWLIRNGANPNINSILRAFLPLVEPHMLRGARTKKLFELIKHNIQNINNIQNENVK